MNAVSVGAKIRMIGLKKVAEQKPIIKSPVRPTLMTAGIGASQNAHADCTRAIRKSKERILQIGKKLKPPFPISGLALQVVESLFCRLVNKTNVLTAAILLSMMAPHIARADGGIGMVSFKCNKSKGYSEIKSYVEYDFSHEHAKDTVSLDDLTEDGKVLECQLDSNYKIIVTIRKSYMHPRNDNVEVYLNKKYVNDLTFDPKQKQTTRITISGHDICVQTEAAKSPQCSSSDLGGNSLQPR